MASKQWKETGSGGVSTRLDESALLTQVWDLSGWSGYVGPTPRVEPEKPAAPVLQLLQDSDVQAVPPPRKHGAASVPKAVEKQARLIGASAQPLVVQPHPPAIVRSVEGRRPSVIVEQGQGTKSEPLPPEPPANVEPVVAPELEILPGLQVRNAAIDEGAGDYEGSDHDEEFDHYEAQAEGGLFGCHEEADQAEGADRCDEVLPDYAAPTPGEQLPQQERLKRGSLTTFALVIVAGASFYGLTALADPAALRPGLGPEQPPANKGSASTGDEASSASPDAGDGREQRRRSGSDYAPGPAIDESALRTAVAGVHTGGEPAVIPNGEHPSPELARGAEILASLDEHEVGQPEEVVATPDMATSGEMQAAERWTSARRVKGDSQAAPSRLAVHSRNPQMREATSANDLGVYPVASKGRVADVLTDPAPRREIAHSVLASEEAAIAPSPSARTRGGDAEADTTVYRFSQARQYRVLTTLNHETDIVLRPGEKVVEQPQVGGIGGHWDIRTVRLRDPRTGAVQDHVRVSPRRTNIETTLTVDTGERSYRIALGATTDGRYMPSVRWLYPEDEARERSAVVLDAYQPKQALDDLINPARIRQNYALFSEQASLTWAPVSVYDDGRRTVIEFPRGIERLPRLEVAISGGIGRATSTPRYWQSGNRLLVDPALHKGRLSLDMPGYTDAEGRRRAARTEVITIVRKGGAR